MNKIANKQVICEVLMEKAKEDRDVVVLCSDSRGSASLTPFADTYPDQFVEVGIAEQSLVSISAGLAKCGKKAYAASPGHASSRPEAWNRRRLTALIPIPMLS